KGMTSATISMRRGLIRGAAVVVIRPSASRSRRCSSLSMVRKYSVSRCSASAASDSIQIHGSNHCCARAHSVHSSRSDCNSARNSSTVFIVCVVACGLLRRQDMERTNPTNSFCACIVIHVELHKPVAEHLELNVQFVRLQHVLMDEPKHQKNTGTHGDKRMGVDFFHRNQTKQNKKPHAPTS